MKTYILKRDVYNNIDFPKGTIIKLLKEEHYNFEVTEGELKGQKGCVADGLNGWVIDDTAQNRKLFKKFEAKENKLQSELDGLRKAWSLLPHSQLK